MKKKPSGVFLSRKHLIRIMKIYSLLIFITISKLFSYNTYSQNISVSLNEVTLQTAIKEIEEKSEYSFFYNNSLIDISKKVSLTVSNEKVRRVLNGLFADTNIGFKIYKNQIVLFPRDVRASEQAFKNLLSYIQENAEKSIKRTAIPDNFSFAQNRIKGIVTGQDGLPLPGVNVLVKGTNKGALTDFDGNYDLAANPGDVLVFSYVGFVTQEIIATNNQLNVTLEEDVSTLDEVVVVAYGTASRSSIVGSVTQIESEDIERRPVTNVLTVLDGAAAGVKITPANGQPGSSPAIRVRGFGSINASNSPLIVVDGVEFVGQFSSLNPNDIANVSILKDAASTSLYGSRAANGVVIITTKKGKKGKDTFTLDISQGVSTRSIGEYERVNPAQYYQVMWEALRNGLSVSGSTPLDEANQQASDEIFDELGINPFNVANDQIVLTDGSINPAAQLRYDDLDWQDPLVRTGYRSNLSFSYGGASETTDYFASLSYLEEDGYIINSDFQRITGRVNVNSQLTKNFKTGINLSVASSESNNANDGGNNSLVNPFRTTRLIASIYPVFLHDADTGEFILDDNGDRQFDSSNSRVGSSAGRNVIQETILNKDSDKIFSVNARTYAEFKFLNDFTFTLNAALDKRFFSNVEFNNPIVGDGAPDGVAEKDEITNTTINYNQLLRYNKSFDDHGITVLLGHESFDTERNFFTANRRGQVVDGNIELINFTTTQDVESNTRRLTREGYFGSFNYDFRNTYYLSGSYRRDASSRFNDSNRWGDFFSIGASWRLDQESFISDIDWINAFKVRASYGEVGNDNLLDAAGVSDFYISQGLFDLGFNNQLEGGVLAGTTGNPDITWETNIQSDAALEFGFFNNRISGTIEYYRRESKDLLFLVPIPTASGLDSRPDNIGDMVNNGWEFDLNLGIIKTTNFNWNLNINAATISNEITKLPQEEIINGTKKLVVGGDIFAYWLRDWYGVDPDDGSGLFILDPDLGAIGDGDVRTTADGTVVTTNQNKAQFDFTGTAIPDVFGAFTNNFRYKNFDLGFTFTYQLGGETYDSNYQNLMHSGSYGVALSTDILNRWQQPGDITDVPRLDANQTAAFGAASDRWLIKSDFLALRQISMAYNFNKDLANKLGLAGAKVYMSGENIFVINERKGLEPGQRFNGTTSNRFSPSRLISLGFNVTF
ncbi:SusC/RagA family TonB-linked outer membrane protein [Aquimarina sp. AU474]|uniref:SusC/RagA family TonB-linked outer membrane protein n=1 Tax=Aquimarina sp. AU474 TaxID=2108529 RepID=UPI001F16893C|nr:SusC/RagA family TonB-linked outer membrane protein [Aquimarina sp. AU474]